MDRIDECKTTFFYDGSVLIETHKKEFLSFDYSEVSYLFKEAKKRKINLQFEPSFCIGNTVNLEISSNSEKREAISLEILYNSVA